VLTHGITYLIFGLSLTIFHLESIFLHIENALLLFLAPTKSSKKDMLLLAGFYFVPFFSLFLRNQFVPPLALRNALSNQFAFPGGSLPAYVRAVCSLFLHQLSAWLLPTRTELFQYLSTRASRSETL
jgi:hypothetical protein